MRTLWRYLKKHAIELGLSGIEYESGYVTFKLVTSDAHAFLLQLSEKIRKEGIDCASLVESTDVPVFEKYDDCIPTSLLRRAYAEDRLRADEVTARILSWAKE